MIISNNEFDLVHIHKRSSGLVKIIPLGRVQGGRRKGRQKKRWEDIRMDRNRVG